MTDKPTRDARPHQATDPSQLSHFQLEICYQLFVDADYGLGLKTDLEAYYGEDVSHSRLYQNLDDLTAQGLIEVSARDRRTNEYALTPAGRELVGRDAQHRLGIVDPEGY